MQRPVRLLAAIAALVPAVALAQPAPSAIPVTTITGGLDTQPLGIAHPNDGSDRLFVIHMGTSGSGAGRQQPRKGHPERPCGVTRA